MARPLDRGMAAPGSAIARLAALPGVSTASGVVPAIDDGLATGQILPVLSAFADVLPRGGLRRGSTVAVHGSASLLLALLAGATASGSWAAAVGIPRLGMVAASELGVEVDRLALVPRPGANLAQVVSALLDGLDLVAVGRKGSSVAPQAARRLSARARNRGAVLLSLGPWPGAEVELRCTPMRWSGAENGYGHLRERLVAVDVEGKGAAARARRATLLLPGPAGAVTAVGDAVAAPLPGAAEGVRAG